MKAHLHQTLQGKRVLLVSSRWPHSPGDTLFCKIGGHSGTSATLPSSGKPAPPLRAWVGAGWRVGAGKPSEIEAKCFLLSQSLAVTRLAGHLVAALPASSDFVLLQPSSIYPQAWPQSLVQLT